MTKTLGICGPLEWIVGQHPDDWLTRGQCIECFGGVGHPDRDKGLLDDLD